MHAGRRSRACSSGLTDQQKDKLVLLIAECAVVFFWDQDISPQQQLEPGDPGPVGAGHLGVAVIWPALFATERAASFRDPGARRGSTLTWCTSCSRRGSRTAQRHGAAYEEPSRDFRKIIDGGLAISRSAHPYLARDDPEAGPRSVERVAPGHRLEDTLGRHASQTWDSGDVIAEKPYFDPNALRGVKPSVVGRGGGAT
ncbi:hypothetical protein DL765_001743 [Monosporascus sp. GIB2]|nr:hypothetical protein DL765_001743 [Monosporascus sp. GIB2]